MPAYDKLAFFIGNWQRKRGGIILEIGLVAYLKIN
ncbi:hypothetical protein SAMN05878281_2807 [Salegentibacter salegens]|uniref:Uncharacterized protein n=1 Tax=Salegentibacter salegens TaxID=143223 RepID=A0A1M7N0S1_9FLAO|nr:hypothetical protein SAMN05878281_2807 [Salegentibacter salegens]